ncbi:Protein of unknown function [Phyllobacterium sp. CL33Tsu]|nr:Protein of unknown function [Phyllobacterium sp. CL33Tsu]
MFGFSERFNDFKYDRDKNIDFVCFTDDPSLTSDFWQIVQATPSTLDPHRRSKSLKHRPHALFPDYSESLYVDNTIRLKRSPSAIFDEFSHKESLLVAFQHPWRDCLYEEAEIVAALGYDDHDLIEKQMCFYRAKGYPKHNGLNATGVLLRRHNDPQVIKAMEAWDAEMMRFSRRDQLSFNYAVRQHGLRIAAFSGSLLDNETIEWITDLRRLPRDFDDDTYLELHEDVARAKLNPRYHYLHHGMDEGRNYK